MSTVAPRRAAPRHASRVDRWEATVEFGIGVINFLCFVVGLALCVNALDGHARVAAAALLTLLGPGSALVTLVGYFDTVVRVVLVAGLSLATSVIVAQVLLTIHHISPLAAAIPLTAITGIGVVVRMARRANGIRREEP